MRKYDFNEEISDDSDSDNDDTLQDEIAALSTVCLPSIASKDDDFSAEDDDDLELVRNIKQQYGKLVGAQPLSLDKPLTSLPPIASDDEDDDFETLRAIKHRFSHYNCGRNVDVGVNESNSDIRKSMPDDSVCMPSVNESVDACRENVEQDPCVTVEDPETSGYTSSFPKVAQTFVEAIKKNRSCQKFIRSKLIHVEARMEEIKEFLKRVKTVRDFQLQCKKKIGRALSQKYDARIQLISASKQRTNGAEKTVSAMCYGPQENAQALCYKATLTKFPLSFHREKWSVDERENLEKGIKQQFQEMVLLKSAFQEPELASIPSEPRLDSVISSISNIEITPQIIQDFSGKVNWEQLASRYCPRRSGAECETRWLNHENRLINRDNWTPGEDKQLLLLIQQYGINDWICIAENLKTNRTPFQCLVRYQRSLNASILKRDWSEDEDAQLRSAVESFGESNWQAVASALEGRTGTQCSNRWNKTLHPTRQRVGKWSDDEDKRLRVAVTLFGHKSWHRIAQFVPGRTQAQCRERWVNVLDPSLNRGLWTEEEDLKLKEAIGKYGYYWSKVAADVPMRTDNQCRRRWMILFPNEVLVLQAAKNIQKVALISNYVDRESERPALGSSDFVPLPTEGSPNELDFDNVPKKRKKSSNSSGKARTKKSRKEASSGSKKKRCSKGAKTTTKLRGKSKSKEAEETEETENTETWDVPVNIRSRRPRGVKLKAIAQIRAFSALLAADLDDTSIDTGENDDPEVHHGQSISGSTKKWEDLPLSVLFPEAVMCLQRKNSSGGVD